jgi:hypothetical protein
MRIAYCVLRKPYPLRNTQYAIRSMSHRLKTIALDRLKDVLYDVSCDMLL